MVEIWLWTAVVGMATGSAGFLIYALAHGHRDDREEWQGFLTFAVPLVAAIAYLAMATGQADFTLGDRTVYWGRYLDWSITTPLLLLHFVVMLRMRAIIAVGLVFSDVLMIVTGFAGALADHSHHIQYLWWTVSTGAFLAVIALLLSQLAAYRRGSDEPDAAGRARVAQRLMVMLLGLWVVYPIVWLVGTTGNGALGPGAETAVYAVVDLIAKVGFGIALTLGVLSLSHPAGRTGAGVSRRGRRDAGARGGLRRA